MGRLIILKRNWDVEELIEHFTLLPEEMQLVGNKSGETRIGFAVLLKVFQYQARFPAKNEIPKAVVQFSNPQLFSQYDRGNTSFEAIDKPSGKNRWVRSSN
jgi:hypothetical protein